MGRRLGGRRVDDAQVAGPHERKLQRARDGRGRHGECVDVHFQLAELLLDRNAELLLFIDDEEAQVFELDALPDEFVRADDDVDVAGSEVFEDFLGLGRGACPREVVDADWEVLQPLGESLVVLQGEHRGRHHHGDLLVVAGRLEGSAHRDFGFTKSHVAADEAVHRAVALHVGLDLLGHFELIGGVFVGKGGFELLLEECVGGVGEALFFAPATVEDDEVAGDVFELFLGLALDALPRTCAEVGESGRFALAAFVLRHLVEGVDGDEDGIVVLIGDFDDLLQFAVGTGHAHQSGKPPHAVVNVHHIVARLKLHQLFERQGNFGIAGVVGTEVVLVKSVEDLVVGEEGDLRLLIDKTLV